MIFLGCSSSPDKLKCLRNEFGDDDLLVIVNKYVGSRPGWYFDKSKGEVKVVKEDCKYYFYFKAVPAWPGGHWEYVIDPEGNVIEENLGR